VLLTKDHDCNSAIGTIQKFGPERFLVIPESGFRRDSRLNQVLIYPSAFVIRSSKYIPMTLSGGREVSTIVWRQSDGPSVASIIFRPWPRNDRGHWLNGFVFLVR
jgi:hypothetical protein